MMRRGDLGDGLADDLGDEGDRARGARVHLEDVDGAVLERILDVHQAANLEVEGKLGGLALELGDDLGTEVLGRERAGAVAVEFRVDSRNAAAAATKALNITTSDTGVAGV